MDRKSNIIEAVIPRKAPEVKMLCAGEKRSPNRLLVAGERNRAPDQIVSAVVDEREITTRIIVSRTELREGHKLHSGSKRAELMLEEALVKNIGPGGKVEMDEVPRLCRLGLEYLKERGPEFPNLVEAGEPLEGNVFLAVLTEKAKDYLRELLGNHGERTLGELKSNPARNAVIAFISGYSRIVKRESETLDALRREEEVPILAEERTGRSSISIPPSANPVFLAPSERGGFEPIGSLRAAERYWESLEGDEPNNVIKAVTGPEGQLIPLISLENKLVHNIIGKGEMRRNACFYLLSKSARKGMNQDIWPAFLKEALESEKWWTGLLISSRKGNEGTFLECGGGDGRCLVQEHERRGLGNTFTVFDYFGHIISIDYSWQMSYAASKSIARKIGKRGVERTRLILGELGDMTYLGSQSVDLAACLFNTFGNMNIKDQLNMSAQLNGALRKFDLEGSLPAMAFFTVYRDKKETVETQEEFYTSGMNMDIVERRGRVTVTRTQENGGTNNNRYTFKSQRFTEEELKMPIESGGLRVLDVFPISTIMWGAIAVSSDVSNGHGNKEKIYDQILSGTEIGRRIKEAKRRDAMESPNWNWDEPVD